MGTLLTRLPRTLQFLVRQPTAVPRPGAPDDGKRNFLLSEFLEHCPALAALFRVHKKQCFYRDDISLVQREALCYPVNRRYSWPDTT